MGFFQKVGNWLKNTFNPTAPVTSGELPVTFADRGIFGQIFTPNAIAQEDYLRAEQSADNQLQRDKQLMEMNNQFNAEQAQIGREWQAQREDTYYQRMVEDMKTAGINPIMAISGGGADVGSTPTASSSSARSSGSNYSGSSASNGLGAIASVLAGLITKGKSSGTTLSQTFNKHGELVRSTINSRR